MSVKILLSLKITEGHLNLHCCVGRVTVYCNQLYGSSILAKMPSIDALILSFGKSFFKRLFQLTKGVFAYSVRYNINNITSVRYNINLLFYICFKKVILINISIM